MESKYSLEEFLDSMGEGSTKNNYRLNINKFSKWYGRTIEEILREREEDWTRKPDESHTQYLNRKSRIEKLIEKYYNENLERTKNKNSARTYNIAVIQLFKYYEMPIILKNSQKRMSQTTMATRNFLMTIDHVRQMFKVADQRERVILSLATDLGVRIGDFSSLKIKDVPDLNGEAPIHFPLMTKKEGVLSQGFISGETIELLRDYIPTLDESKNPYLFPDKNGGHISDVWFNELLQKLAIKSGIKVGDKALTFHCFRKMFISAGIDSGVGLTAAKILCGKSVSQSDETYFTVAKWKPQFLKLKEYITIQGFNNKSSESVESLKKTISDMDREHKKEVESLKTVISSHAERLDLLQGMIIMTRFTDEQHKQLNKFIEQIKSIPKEEYASLSPEIDRKLEEEVEKLTGLKENKYIINQIKQMINEVRNK
jgi:integrase